MCQSRPNIGRTEASLQRARDCPAIAPRGPEHVCAAAAQCHIPRDHPPTYRRSYGKTWEAEAPQPQRAREGSSVNPRTVVQTMITLASASLGLVAALAWNEAIKATIARVLGEADDLTGLYS